MTRSRPDIDPVTLEVIRNRLESIVREMGDITLRTARSAVVYIGRDFSCAILSPQGELMAVGTSIPIHIFPIVWQVRKTLERFGDDIKPGDMFIGNDPYDGGTHLNDVLIFTPIYFQDELVGYAANRAHWYDIGGMVPGSISGSARELFQEGLRIPPIRLGRNDEPYPDTLDLILRNVRVPEETKGDLNAQVASCRIAGQRIQTLMERYGKDSVLGHFDEILDSAERRMRSLIANLPQTTVAHEGYMDNDGVGTDQRPIRTTITVQGDDIHVDYTGTAPQAQGPLNVSLALAHCFAFMGVKAALDPSGPINSGCFRPIKVTVPEGTMLNAKAPAPAGGMAEMGQTAIHTMLAMSKLVPENVSAEEGAAGNHQNLGGEDLRFEDPHRYIYYDYPGGGGGGRADKDGLDFVRTMRSGNVNIQAIEVLENLFPVFFHRHALREDSGGPGEFRGGMGAVREYRVPTDVTFSILGDHAVVPPSGLYGGHAGATSVWEVVREGQASEISPEFHSKATAFPLKAGDTVRIRTQGGGGYGDPLERDPARVREDVLDRKVSLQQARDAYGVVLDPGSLEVDEPATRAQRARLGAERIHLTPQRGDEPAHEKGMRLARVSPALGQWGVVEGQMVDIFSPALPNPLRVRIRIGQDVPEDAVLLDREAWKLLGLTGGERLLWRPL